MSQRVVFRGRFIADGMWLTHLTWGVLTLPFIVGGLWACWMSTTQVAVAGALAFMGLLFLLVGLVMACVWKVASHAIVLKPDGLWCRPGFARSVFVPYQDMTFLGVTPQGFLLGYQRQRHGQSVRLKLHLPPWALSNRLFREELRSRAPQLGVSDETVMRLWAFKSRMGALTSLWLILLAPWVFLALPWRSQGSLVSMPVLVSGAVVWVVVLVALAVWQATGQRRIERESRPSTTDEKRAE